MKNKVSETIEYYNDNAKEYFDYTVNVDMSEHYERFLKYLPDNAYILDVGCGSGRDSMFFKSAGYKVKAIDGSEKLCELASTYLGEKVENKRFLEIDYTDMFEGIWANASLLHAERNTIDSVVEKLWKALKEKGIIYASFKYGDGDRVQGDRYYNDQNEETIKELFKDFKIRELWKSDDKIPGRNDKWINIIAVK